MKNNTLRIVAVVMGVIVTTSLVAVGTYAFQGNKANWENKFSPEEIAEKKALMEERNTEHEARRAAVQEALNNKDYNAWVSAVGEDCPMLEKINEDNFPRLVEAHELKQQAREIMEELGIEKKGFGKRMHKRYFMNK